MKRKLSLRKNTIKQIALKYGWSGTGQQDDPYIIDSLLDQYPTVSLTMIDTFIKLKNISLNKLGLNHCKNVVIENCKIINLKLESCKDIEIKNNSILKLRSVFSRELIFEENAILERSYTRLVSNYYEKITSTLIYTGTILGLIFMAQCLIWFIESKITML